MEQAAICDVPVVEASLLTGSKGSVLVLVNYTYQPIESLTIDLKLADAPRSAVSTEGKPVRMERTAGGVRLHLPLEWTDMVVLR